MPKFALIYNPKAKRNRKFPWRMYRYRSIMRRLGGDGAFIVSENLTHLEEILADLRQREFGILGICGGDGSVQIVLSAVQRMWAGDPLPRFALIKGGTMNTIVTAIGFHGMGRSLLRGIVHHLLHDLPLREVEHPMLRINDTHCFIFGLGLATRFMTAYYEGGGGARTAIKVISKAVPSLVADTEFGRWVAEPFQARVTLDGQVWSMDRFTTILAGTIDRYPLNFMLMPRAREREGHFQIRFTSMPLRGYIGNIYILHRGRPTPLVPDAMSQKAEIELAVEQPAILDGEVTTLGARLSLELGQPLTFVGPA
ncbi:MAG: hypothetical protein HYY13_01550 [Nitrospirae bacterium]|nr:hypothetical protein [Nitrospirota bacterium]